MDWRGLRTVVRTYLGAAPPMPAAVAALMTALMLVDLLGSDGAHCGLPAAAGRNDAWLGAVLGDLAGAPVLQAMLDVTAACAEPLRYAPAPWDDEEDWRLVPLADLRWHAERGGGDWTRAAARAELCRRRAAVVREAGEPRARVLLRRGARQAP